MGWWVRGWCGCGSAVAGECGAECVDVAGADPAGEFAFEFGEDPTGVLSELAAPVGQGDQLGASVVLVGATLDELVGFEPVEEFVDGLTGHVQLPGEVADLDWTA